MHSMYNNTNEQCTVCIIIPMSNAQYVCPNICVNVNTTFINNAKQIILQTKFNDDGDGANLISLWMEFQREEESKENQWSQSFIYGVYVDCVEA